jgi:hypothetical protein
MTSPEYSTIHIDQLLLDTTGIAAGNEIFFSDKHRFCTGVVQLTWLLASGFHALVCMQGCSVNVMHSLYSLPWFIVLPAHRYCSVSEHWHCHLCILVQQDINLCHSPCFQDLTKAITMHVASNILVVFCTHYKFFMLRRQLGKEDSRRISSILDVSRHFYKVLCSRNMSHHSSVSPGQLAVLYAQVFLVWKMKHPQLGKNTVNGLFGAAWSPCWGA